MATGIVNDIRQTFSIVRMEFHKNLVSRRFLTFIVLIALMVAVITALPHLIDLPSALVPVGSEPRLYVAFPLSDIMVIPTILLIPVLAATTFASTTLSSDYKSRTGLILFSKPIRKGSIFVGKFLTAFLTNVLMILIYCLIVTIVVLLQTNELAWNYQIWYTMVCTIPYSFAVTGIVFFFSMLLKKSGTVTLASFCVLILGGLLCDLLYGFNFIDPHWYSIFYANDFIWEVGFWAFWGLPSYSVLAEAWLQGMFVVLGWGLLAVVISFLIYRTKHF